MSECLTGRVAVITLYTLVITVTITSSACDTICTTGQSGPALLATIQVPGHPLDAFDVSWVDPMTRRFYLADRANAGVEIIDTEKARYLQRIEGFAGNADHDHSGPNGILVLPDLQQLWAGDGDSSVKVIDLQSSERFSISTGGQARADELSYDADDQLVLVVNNAETISDDPTSGSFATLISTAPEHAIRGRLAFHDASAGLEQSVWDPIAKRFYLAIPELGGDPSAGAIAVIDPQTVQVTNMYTVSECEPAGIALGPDQQLLVGCSGDAIEAGFAAKTILLNAADGSTLETFNQVGGSDEVWFNRGDGNYYLAARDNPSGPVLGVINAASKRFVANTATGEDAKSVAVDPQNSHVFMGLTPTTDASANDPTRALDCRNGCIGVFAFELDCSNGDGR